MIKRLALPQTAAGSFEEGVDLPGGRFLDPARDSLQIDVRTHQEVNVVYHHHVGEQVIPKLRPVQQALRYDSCTAWISENTRARLGAVQVVLDEPE